MVRILTYLLLSLSLVTRLENQNQKKTIINIELVIGYVLFVITITMHSEKFVIDVINKLRNKISIINLCYIITKMSNRMHHKISPKIVCKIMILLKEFLFKN